MNILITERPSENGYIESLINAYLRASHTVVCDVSNFFYSNYVPDILHIHWPESLYQWCSIEAVNEIEMQESIEERLLWYKRNGTTIIHTIHNLCPHDSKQSRDQDVFNLVIQYADLLVHHCAESINLTSDSYPDVSRKKNIIYPN